MHLFPRIRRQVPTLLNGYLQHSRIPDKIDEYIAPPVLGSKTGVLGAMVPVMQAQS